MQYHPNFTSFRPRIQEGFSIMPKYKPESKLKAIRCKISRGGFSGERVFTITANGVDHSGVGSRFYMWKEDRTPVDEGEPPIGQEIDGLVAARVLDIDGTTATVTIPDGDVIEISVGELLDRPAMDLHVPIG
jgi:hypothetical protein